MTGMVGNKWTLDTFEPMGSIPTAVNLTTYAGGPEEFIETPLEELVQQIAHGKLKVQVSLLLKPHSSPSSLINLSAIE